MATARQLLDTRGDTKLASFSGDRSKFEAWAFLFESYGHLLGWGEQIDMAIKEQAPIEAAALGDVARSLNHDLYYLLASKMQGPAASVVKLVERGNGLEAVRMLYKEYRTGLAEDHSQMLSMILTPDWWKTRDQSAFVDTLLAWDELISQYELATSEKVTDKMKVATILAHSPQMVKDTLHSATREVRGSYATVRQFIWENLLARRVAGPPMDSTAMDVDAVQKGGGGKGEVCAVCGKPGHKPSACWWRPGGGKDPKGKSPGKGKGDGKDKSHKDKSDGKD